MAVSMRNRKFDRPAETDDGMSQASPSGKLFNVLEATVLRVGDVNFTQSTISATISNGISLLPYSKNSVTHYATITVVRFPKRGKRVHRQSTAGST
jgi:hypothetical protein